MKRVRNVFVFVLVITGISAAPLLAEEESLRQKYVDALRKDGYAEMAVDFLRLELGRITEPEEKADLEFEIAFSLTALAETLNDLSRRGQISEEAAASISELVKKYPTHPRRPEALSSLALIDLQQGRIKVLLAQLPANAGQMQKLAADARQSMEKSIGRYEAARDQLLIAYKKMPIFIPDDQPAERRKKSKLFEQYIEARFQAALARFHLADSYKTIEMMGEADAKKSAAAKGRYEKLLAEAAKAFEDIYNEHRREVVGLYAHLWLARCWASLGDQRRANGIFAQLMDHDNKSIEKFQRQVFYFRMIAYSEQKQYDQLLAEAEVWLRTNQKYSRENDYLGVLLEVGMARLIRGDRNSDEKAKRNEYLEADRTFQRISSFSNAYTGLARRQQLKLAEYLNKDVNVRGFQQLVSVATAKLDKVTPNSPPAEKKQLLGEAKKLLQDAIDFAKANESPENMNEARLTLAFAHFTDDELMETAILSESIAKYSPKSAMAPQAALLAANAYALSYERSMDLQKRNIRAFAEVDADRIRAICNTIFERWPTSKEAMEGRLMLGRLEYQKLQYLKAAEIFAKADPNSPRYAEALSLAGRALWDHCKANRQSSSDAAATKQSRDSAAQKLAQASKPLLELRNGKVDREVFLNDAYLAEVLFDQGKDSEAYGIVKPYIDSIEKNDLPADIDTKLKIDILITALQSLIRLDKLQDGDRLVEIISKQKGQSESGNVTQVFINLASRIKSQIEALKAAGEEQRRLQMVKAFEKFLNRIAERETGQTINSLVDLGNNFLELENYQRAIELNRRALQMPQAKENPKSPVVYRAKINLADALARSKNFEEARPLIDALYRDNKNIKEVVMKRGEILESQGDYKAAVAHWKDIVKRMQKVQPRPREFYDAIKHLVELADRFQGEERIKRLKEAHYFAQFLVTTDTNLPEDLRGFFQEAIARIESQVGKN